MFTRSKVLLFIILFGNCTCTKLCYYYVYLCYNIVSCINILFNNKLLLYLEYNGNGFKFVVLLKNLYCCLRYTFYSCSHAMFVITELE